MQKKICVIGLGYIGLPTAIIAAQHGLDVIGFDIDKTRVDKINAGQSVIEEPEISENLAIALASGNLRATDQIEHANYYLVAVPTPFNEDKSADLSYVWQAAESIACVLRKGDVIILESTVPVKTTEQLAANIARLSRLNPGTDFYVAHCPERVLPGKIFHELIYNPRIIGGINEESVDAAKVFYKFFCKGALYLTDARSAEMVKLIENSSRDVQIAFANQVAAIASQLELDPFEIIELANKHPRVSILNPGCGVGGHCIAVDPWFLISEFPEQTALLKSARIINDQKPMQVIATIKDAIKEWTIAHTDKIPTVLLLGLTYKADIDDLRESPSLAIAREIVRIHKKAFICEPNITHEKVQEVVGGNAITLLQGIAQADIIVCLVKHKKFMHLEKKELTGKIILDLCGLFYQPKVQEHFFWPAKNQFSSREIQSEEVT
jgi:UDP-N-acetyl-D-mannosaminuronic acid dehydrogenase